MRHSLFATAAVIALGGVALAQVAPDVQRGRVLASTYCAECHSIDKVGPSPLSIAPPFRTLHENYPVENLEEALVEGIVTGHPSMPQFSFDPDQASNLIAYMKTLE
ncbi:c-type cytochrome [Hoeflea sp.]|uniref:c-type cytochrome n=1 Tax=Hoeflea sp. TaxID=1940281 RepID=UPI003B026FEC